MAKETFERVKPHVNVGCVQAQVAQLQQLVRGNRQLEPLAKLLADGIGNGSGQSASDIPVVPNSMSLGFSNVMAGISNANTNIKPTVNPAIQTQLSRLKMLLRGDHENWNTVVILEAVSGRQSQLLAHELTHVAQQSKSPQVRRYASLLLPAVQKVK